MRKIVAIIAYLYTFLLVFASLGKFAISVPAGVKHSDKIAHTIAYIGFVCVWTLYLYVRASNRELSGKQLYFNSIVRAGIAGVLFGILMEVFQWVFTSYRQFDVLDMLANTIGIVLGAVLLVVFINFLTRIKKSIE